MREFWGRGFSEVNPKDQLIKDIEERLIEGVANPSLSHVTRRQIAKLPTLFINSKIPEGILKTLHQAIAKAPVLIPDILKVILVTFANDSDKSNTRAVFQLFLSVLQKYQITIDIEERDLLYSQFTQPDRGRRGSALKLFEAMIEVNPDNLTAKVKEKLEGMKRDAIAADPLKYNFGIDSIANGYREITEELVRQALDAISVDFRPTEKEKTKKVSVKERSPLKLEWYYRAAVKFLAICIERAPSYIPQISEFCQDLLLDRNTELKRHVFEVYAIILEKAPKSITEKDVDRIFKRTYPKVAQYRTKDMAWVERMFAVSTCRKAIEAVPHLITKERVDTIQKMFVDQNSIVNRYAVDAYASIIRLMPQFVNREALRQIVYWLKEGTPEYDEESGESYYPENERELMWAAYLAFMTALKYTPEFCFQFIPLILNMKIDYGHFLQILQEPVASCNGNFQDRASLYQFMKNILNFKTDNEPSNQRK